MLRPLSAIGLLLWAIALPAQTFDRSLNFGFENSADVLAPLSGGRWLVAGRGTPWPGLIVVDTIFALVIDASTNVLLEKRLSLPLAEVHKIGDALGTPDGGFLICASTGDCDACCGETVLQKFDAAGQLQWVQESVQGHPNVEKLLLSPDGYVLGLTDKLITKFDPANGVVIWQAYPGNEFQHIEWQHLALLPGTEDIAMAAGRSLRLWKQNSTPNGPGYNLAVAMDYAPGVVIFDGLAVRPDGWAYAVDGNTKFVRFGEGLAIETLPNLPFPATGIFSTAEGFIFLAETNDRSLAIRTDSIGQIMDTLLYTGIGIHAAQVSMKADTLLVIGLDISGKSPFIPSDGNASHLWVHAQADNATPTSWGNIGITGVEQLDSIHVKENFFGGPFPPYYTLYDAGFRVQVTNFGAVPVNTFYVSHAFGWASSYFCSDRPVTHLRFDGPMLAPGESRWLDMGKIGATDLTSVPTEYCFWTSSPNGRPDDDHLDDNFCHSIVLDTETPVAPISLSIAPNPTGTEGFWLTLPSTTLSDHDLAYRLFDAMGRLVASGQFAPGEARQHIPTTQLPGGLYTLHAGKWKARMAVQR